MKLMQALFAKDDGLAPVRQALHVAQPVQSVPPWSFVGTRAVGGLSAVGFDRQSETLIVVSSNGQSVIDATTGTQLYRNRDDDGFDGVALKAARLDHPASERVDMAGLAGGALPTVTHDGWSVDQLTPDWPSTHCVLHPTGASIFFHKQGWDTRNKDSTFHLLACETEDIRAFGFSWSGLSLLLATSGDLRIWARPAPLQLI